MTSGSNLTVLPGVPDSSQAKPGMAYFEGTGPAGKTCSSCQHKGYWRTAERLTVNRKTGKEEHQSSKFAGCDMYRKLSGGRHGAAIQEHYKACKYYEGARR